MQRAIRVQTIMAAALLMAACGPTLPPPAAGPGAGSPRAAIERFLAAVAISDFLEMGWVFGTERGPIVRRDPPAEVERRMYVVASILQHERYGILSESRVPGRIGSAVRFDVAVWQRGREHVVPFTVVRGPGERWFVEQIDLEVLTGRP